MDDIEKWLELDNEVNGSIPTFNPNEYKYSRCQLFLYASITLFVCVCDAVRRL